jgi:hypothetical protein
MPNFIIKRMVLSVAGLLPISLYPSLASLNERIGTQPTATTEP